MAVAAGEEEEAVVVEEDAAAVAKEGRAEKPAEVVRGQSRTGLPVPSREESFSRGGEIPEKVIGIINMQEIAFNAHQKLTGRHLDRLHRQNVLSRHHQGRRRHLLLLDWYGCPFSAQDLRHWDVSQQLGLGVVLRRSPAADTAASNHVRIILHETVECELI